LLPRSLFREIPRLPKLSKIGQVLRSARLTSAVFSHRVLAGVEHRFVLRSDLATVVDVGANRGQFTLAARHYAPGARVISFEPQPAPAAIFRRLFAGDPRVTLHEAALGAAAERRSMHVSGLDDSSSLLPITLLYSSLFPGTEEASALEVRVGPLSDFVGRDEIRPPALLKLDIQGFEYDALLGCRDLLPLFERVYCECSFMELYTGQKLGHEVVALLAQNGFVLAGAYNPVYDAAGQCVHSDLLFMQLPA
jgi:FkbM family methyltransferase